MPLTGNFTHYVFVDFENVPSVDLAPMAGKPVHVTLLIGEKQKRLDLTLVRQIHTHASQVTLIEVGASGRNALDLVLAAHLGRAVVEHPDSDFTIVSKDKDFDPLIAHLRANNVRVGRQPDFCALPVLGTGKRHRPSPAPPAPMAKHPSAPSAANRRGRTAPPPTRDARMQKLIDRLSSTDGPRPKNRNRLLRHISATFGNRLSETELAERADELVARGIVAIDADDRVTYPSGRSTPTVAVSRGTPRVRPIHEKSLRAEISG